MKILHYDCFAGISGDMNIGALLSLGLPREHLLGELGKLGLPDWRLNIEKDSRKGITGVRADVRLDGSEDMPHRTMRDIEAIFNGSALDEKTIEYALKIFSALAGAEAEAHGTTPDQVHFHEVGAVDSIIDIAAAAVGFRYFEPDLVQCGTVELGGGTVWCAHGILPVPAPATQMLISGFPVSSGGVDFEATTPTGAAILNAFCSLQEPPPVYSIVKTGYGIGQKDGTLPNILRISLRETEERDETVSELALLSCNIDDMSGEYIAPLIDALLEAGALDAWLQPIIMKKNRPAVEVRALVEPWNLEKCRETLFLRSRTLGVRQTQATRHALMRGSERVATEWGTVSVKYALYNGMPIKAKAEFEECMAISRANGVMPETVAAAAESLFRIRWS